MTFDDEIGNSREDDEIQLPWPEFPYKIIEEWFSFIPGQKVFFFPKGINSKHFFYIMKKEYPAQNLIVLPWPEIPSNEIENWLELSNGNLVDYLPTGISTVSCVIIGKN